jgi:HTH-type transcriptional regulator / antitoxin HigA
MQIRPIRTDKDHRAALAEIEKLLGASLGTPKGDKLDILVTLVERYEERRWPLKSRRRLPALRAACQRAPVRRFPLQF